MTWDEALIDAAVVALDDAGDGDRHTVAAAVRCGDGRIVTGVNLYHFTGGPCAEMVALANAAGCSVVRVVAVGDDGRGVVPPCGRCRQVMLDLFPGVEVMLPHGLVASVAELLPHGYLQRD